MRVGIDVGGTFTDLVALDDDGAFVRLKVASTPAAPERGVFDAVAALFAALPARREVALVAHSSTIATNALLGQMQLDLPRVALVTTAGFRDVIEIGRQNRSEVYNLFVTRPRPLVAREDRVAVRERVGPFGEVLEALDPASLADVVDALRARGVTSVAVGLLNAYANDAHERAVGAAVTAALPGTDVTLSSEIDREYREYERFSTAVVNAVLVPIVRRYLLEVAAGLRERGVNAPVYVMQSNGGMAAIEHAARRPVTLIESGPASGVIGAAYVARALGIDDVLSFDMGGTTAKAGTVFGGEPQVVTEFEAAGRTHSGRAVKGSGYPVRFPFVDLAEVSAGGGTIAWVDAGGGLRVGPLSAGADPGPAAYGKGDRATVTDANIVLGRLNPAALLGGTFAIDAERARAAVAAVARDVALDVERCAAGIVHLVDVEMAKVLRIVSVERGYDPRTFALMAFGGGGPLHACALADELGIARILVPPHPGVFSAFGLLAADVRAAYVEAFLERADAVEEPALADAFARMERRGAQELSAQGVASGDMTFARECDLRYEGQSFELTVPFAGTLAQTARAFGDKHERTYGYASPGEPVELVGARVLAQGRLPKPAASAAGARGGGPAPRAVRRSIWTGDAYADAPVFERAELACGTALPGPCVVEQYDATTYVAPGWTCGVDALGNLRLERGAA